MTDRLIKTSRIERMILLRMLKESSKGAFLISKEVSNGEMMNEVRVANNLVIAGLLRCTNMESNRFELTAKGEATAIEILGEKTNKLPETVKIESKLLLEALNNVSGRVHLSAFIGCGDERINELRIARNLVIAGLLRCIDFKNNLFELTLSGERIAVDLQYEKAVKTRMNFSASRLKQLIKENFFKNLWKYIYVGADNNKYAVIASFTGYIGNEAKTLDVIIQESYFLTLLFLDHIEAPNDLKLTVMLTDPFDQEKPTNSLVSKYFPPHCVKKLDPTLEKLFGKYENDRHYIVLETSTNRTENVFNLARELIHLHQNLKGVISEVETESFWKEKLISNLNFCDSKFKEDNYIGTFPWEVEANIEGLKIAQGYLTMMEMPIPKGEYIKRMNDFRGYTKQHGMQPNKF